MARKVYAISNINGGIGNDKNFPKPWTVVDCENIDISADSNSIKIAGNDKDIVINHSGLNGRIIGQLTDGIYFTNKGIFFDDYAYPAFFLDHNVDEASSSRIISLPDLIPIRSNGPELGGNGWHNQEAETNTNIAWFAQYGNFLIVATSDFLHVISGRLQSQSIISAIPQDWEYSFTPWSGWEHIPGHGIRHNEWAVGMYRHFLSTNSWFQYEFAFKDFISWSITIAITYKANKYVRSNNNDTQTYDWVESQTTYRKQITLTANDANKHDIHKLCCLGENISNVKIWIVPKNDFRGTLCYNALSEAPLYERSYNLQESGGIAYNVCPIPKYSNHQMFVLNNILFVGCGDVMKTFTIEKSERYPETWITLIPWEDIELGIGTRIVGIGQYGSWIIIYANRGNNAYQIFTNGVWGAVEESIPREAARFISVSNNGYQDFVVAEIWRKHHLYIVSWWNKSLLYSGGSMPEYYSSQWPLSDYLMNFGGSCFAREDRLLISSKERFLYLYEWDREQRRLTKFGIGKKTSLTHADVWWDEISYFVFNQDKKTNTKKTIKLNGDWAIHENLAWSVVLPPLLAHLDWARLQEIRFWTFLPNAWSKIEIWGKINEKDYITLEVKDQKGKDFSKCTINKNITAELIDQQLDPEGNGYLSFRITGNFNKLKERKELMTLYDTKGKILTRSYEILSYDYFIKIEEITRENQKMWAREIGYNHSVSIKKINEYIGDFWKLLLKIILKSEKWSCESPKLYAPIYLIYNTKNAY